MQPNPRVPEFLRAVTWVECVVVAAAAGLLLSAPEWGGSEVWAWRTPPLNARYVGVVYLGALVPLVVFAARGRWSPGRLVLWEIFVFTVAIMVVMLAYAGRFEWARLATWVFWPLYVFLPVNSAVFLWRLRDWRPPEPLSHARAALTVVALSLGGYGVALLIIPGRATEFWPWPVDAFHARIYAAAYLAPAVGAWVLRRGATPEELRTLGITFVTMGVAAIVAVPTNRRSCSSTSRRSSRAPRCCSVQGPRAVQPHRRGDRRPANGLHRARGGMGRRGGAAHVKMGPWSRAKTSPGALVGPPERP